AEALHAAIGRPPRFSPLTIDGTAKALIAWQVGGFPGLSAHVDYARARLVLFVGSNPIVSHGHNNGLTPTAIRALRRRAGVWVLDPPHTETARLAPRPLAPRPGTDYAVLAYLVREVLRDGADREVLERRALGIEALAAAVEPFALARAARVADVPEAELTELLGAVRRAGCVAVETGTGITMSATANVTQWLAWGAMIATGAMKRPGRAWCPPRVPPAVRIVRGPRGAARRAVRAGPAQPARGAVVPRRMAVRGARRRDPRRQHPRGAEPRRPPRHCVPRDGRPRAGAAVARCARDDRDHRQRDHRAVDPRAADQGPARARGRHAVGYAGPPRRGAARAGARRSRR